MPVLVYIPGVWDLLHVGHIQMLSRAKALGDVLIVGVPSDRVVEEDKGVLPVIPLQDRVRILESLRCVDMAVPYHKLEFLTHLELFKPDILVVGETWGKEDRHKAAEKWVQENNRRIVTLPYYHGEATTKIKERICERATSPR